MPNQKHYLIAGNPTTSLKAALSKNGIDQKTIIGIDDFEVMECASFEKARSILEKLIQPVSYPCRTDFLINMDKSAMLSFHIPFLFYFCSYFFYSIDLFV